jgi:hypothetical protein
MTSNVSSDFFASFYVRTNKAAKALATKEARRGMTFVADLKPSGNWSIIADTYAAVKAVLPEGKSNITKPMKVETGLDGVDANTLTAIGKVIDEWPAFVAFVVHHNTDKANKTAGGNMTSLRVAVSKYIDAKDEGGSKAFDLDKAIASLLKRAEKAKVTPAAVLRGMNVACAATIKAKAADKPAKGNHTKPIAAKPRKVRKSTANGAGMRIAA